MKSSIFSVLLTVISFVLIQVGFHSHASAQFKRHTVIYGGFKDADIVSIAEKTDILIVGKISYYQLNQLKTVNPDLIILKYYHCIGIYRSFPEWNIVNQHEDWFAHDRITDHRLTQKNRGWYLMNIASNGWRQFIADKIAKQTNELYDGIFIDNFWDRFIRKFTAEGTSNSASLNKDLIINWGQNMITLLTQIRAVYPKLIFINGAHKQYINYVDGCMEESFIHSNWTPDTKHHTSTDYLRSLKRIQDLAQHKKFILAQSGTRGDDRSKTNDIYRLCFASFLMVWDKNISFNFHPSHTYSYRGFYQAEDYRLNLGKPLGNYYLFRVGKINPNLLPNGNFDTGLKDWKVISGNPTPDGKFSISGKSVRFKGSSGRSDKIGSGFIPVNGETHYTISANLKSEKNISVSQRYKRFGIQGRFYDKNNNPIPGRYNLLFNAGNYEWQPFQKTLTSPQNAVYFQIKIGFGAGGIGHVWLDDVYFGTSEKREMVFRRDFSRGSVFVNYGNKKATVNIKTQEDAHLSEVINLNAREGKIVQYYRQ